MLTKDYSNYVQRHKLFSISAVYRKFEFSLPLNEYALECVSVYFCIIVCLFYFIIIIIYFVFLYVFYFYLSICTVFLFFLRKLFIYQIVLKLLILYMYQLNNFCHAYIYYNYIFYFIMRGVGGNTAQASGQHRVRASRIIPCCPLN